MTHVFKVMDITSNKEQDVKSFREVLTFMVVQTANLLIQSRLTTEELIKLQSLEHNSGEITLLNRFIVISKFEE